MRPPFFLLRGNEISLTYHISFSPYSLIKALRFSLFSVKLARCKSKATRIDLLVSDLGTPKQFSEILCFFLSSLFHQSKQSRLKCELVANSILLL